jgi:hypothetical protein
MTAMTSQRSMFTEAIEDHLALKKQNSHLQAAMPIDRFDVGDPLDRYPGGPVRPATGLDDSPAAELAAGVAASAAAMAATSLGTPQDGVATSHAAASVVEGEFRRPLEPLGGMTPMLSLVEDLDEDDDASTAMPSFMGTGSEAVASTMVLPADTVGDVQGSVVRFPGGAGPREEQQLVIDAAPEQVAETTGEQPVIVIDADEPLAPSGATERREAREASRQPGARKRPSFFGLRRKKQQEETVEGAGWFAQAPRDFDWD